MNSSAQLVTRTNFFQMTRLSLEASAHIPKPAYNLNPSAHAFTDDSQNCIFNTVDSRVWPVIKAWSEFAYVSESP